MGAVWAVTWNTLPDGADPAFAVADAPAPLFRDPAYDGAADPSLITDPAGDEWWCLYTQRRANAPVHGKGWIHGSDVGVAVSDDAGESWLYRGTLDLAYEPGHNTYWAPEVFHHNGTYHLFVSYITGVPRTWDRPRDIVHYTNDELALEGWTLERTLDLSSDRVIDPDVHRLPDGTWRMWYKDERSGSYTHVADSEDLASWDATDEPILDGWTHEAPVVAEFQDRYWLLADSWDGLSVWRSADGETWEAQPHRLLADPGERSGDDWQGGHPDLVVVDDAAYVFYHVHQSLDAAHAIPDAGERARQTALQVAELDIEDGWLTCDRDRYA